MPQIHHYLTPWPPLVLSSNECSCLTEAYEYTCLAEAHGGHTEETPRSFFQERLCSQ